MYMVDSRVVDPRISLNINPDQLIMPFMYIQDQYGYSVESIVRKINTQSILHLGVYPNTFPNTITEYYWIKYETNTNSMKWVAIGKLNSDQYFFYSAYCNNVPKGFLQDGAIMHLWVSSRYSDLIYYAMSQEQYNVYFNETVTIVPISDKL